jgi:hypothetical protein
MGGEAKMVTSGQENAKASNNRGGLGRNKLRSNGAGEIKDI